MKLLLKVLCLFTVMACNTTNTTMEVNSKKIIGIAVETTNQNGQAGEDLGKLWGRFFEVSDQIPNKKSDQIYSVYTHYETDYQGKYTAIVGYEVTSLQRIPDGFIGKEIGGGRYEKFIAKGEMPQAVMQSWESIWSKDEELNRAYTADFEVYGEKSRNGKESEVEIFIAVE